MRQYTTPEQTAKLIELGFEKPKSAISVSWDVPEDDGIMINANSIEFDYSYSIGELIEMLPNFAFSMKYHPKEKWWWIGYYEESIPVGLFCFELCDALYEFILALKDLGRL